MYNAVMHHGIIVMWKWDFAFSLRDKLQINFLVMSLIVVTNWLEIHMNLYL